MELASAFSAFVLGGLVGLAELSDRYKGGVKPVWEIPPAYLYLGLNAFAALIGLALLEQFNMDFGVLSKSELGKVLLAGTGSMMILRSSFFTVRANGKTTQIGLGGITAVFLGVADRAFDQIQAAARLDKVEQLMKGVDFDRAQVDLTTLCLALMQNLSYEEQQALSAEVLKLAQDKNLKFNKTKAISLGLILSKITGVELLEGSIKKLSDEIGKKKEDQDLDRKFDRVLKEREEKVIKLQKKLKGVKK